MYEIIRKRLMWFIIILVFVKYASTLESFHSRKYKEKGYEVLVPAGWKHSKKHSAKIKSENSYQETIVAVFVPVGHEKRKAEELDAKISIFSTKLANAMWIEDEWSDIIMSIRRAGMHVIDKGEIKVDTEVSHWVFFHDKQAEILTIEFYIITENNMFFKIQYSTQDMKFNDYRPGFEEFKGNFKVKASLW